MLSRPEGATDFQLQYRDVEHLRQSGALAPVAAWSSGWGLAVEGTEGAAASRPASSIAGISSCLAP